MLMGRGITEFGDNIPVDHGMVNFLNTHGGEAIWH